MSNNIELKTMNNKEEVAKIRLYIPNIHHVNDKFIHGYIVYLYITLIHLICSLAGQPLLLKKRDRGSGEWSYFHLSPGMLYELPMKSQY